MTKTKNEPIIDKTNMNKFFVYGSEGLHEYNIVTYDLDKNKVYELYYSNGTQWLESTKDKLIMSITDNVNNEYNDEYNDNFTLRFFDYAQISCLYLLLNFIKEQYLLETPNSFDTYKYINSNTFKTI